MPLPPPQATTGINPASTGATARKLRFPLRERVRLRLIPINAKPATDSQAKANRLGAPCVAGGTLTAAATAPAVTVTVALALPSESKVIEFELSEHVGAPICAGATLHDSDTGLSNSFSRLKLSVEEALCPWLRILGVGADAEMEKSVPVLSSTAIELSELITPKSGALSPF